MYLHKTRDSIKMSGTAHSVEQKRNINFYWCLFFVHKSFITGPLPCCCCLNIKCRGAVCRYGQSALVHLQHKQHTWFIFHMHRPTFSMASNRKQPVTRLLDIVGPPNVIPYQPDSQASLHWNCEGEKYIVSCPDPPLTCKRSLVF